MESASGEVTLHAEGMCEDGFGGWAAVLVHNSRQRTIVGMDTGVTPGQMALKAVVEGLEALTRPCRVRICVEDETLREHRAMRTLPDEPDLRRRLRPLLAQHHVIWDEGDDESERWDEAVCELAAELAHHQVRGASLTGPAEDGVEATLAAVLSSYLVEQWDDMDAFKEADAAIGTLRFSIGWYGDKPSAEMAPAEIVEHLSTFFHTTLPHKQHASPHEIRTAGKVVSDLLEWLVVKGHLDAGAARSAVEDIDTGVDELAPIAAFVSAFESDDLVPWPENSLIEEHVDCEYLTIDEVSTRSITLHGDDGRVVGPVTVRPGIAVQAQTGWRILLSAVKVRGRWGLVQVVSGDP
ncbi:hypothetical protein [Streptomyces sp. NBC_00690]|uniref:hypothetical protein n=1 Tax=Streptomyces sp. NBC_00690 TaxID=2975808 RepID=UPI002E2DE01F|nr:hypothetical protein [Streptomyces sp. NBC_00690]